MQLTEGMSLIAADPTVLAEGMVLTLEPGIDTVDGRIMVHEENIVVTQDGCRFLSPRAGPEMMVIE
jgi:Xaa-Pro aminopeptidase